MSAVRPLGNARFALFLILAMSSACVGRAGYEKDGERPTPDKIQGDACLSAESCSTGFCVDGVCCESSCAGVCSDCGPDGFCDQTPIDDAECGTIICDVFDTSCRDYLAIETNRCSGFGVCRTPSLMTCSSYSDAPSSTICRPAAGLCDLAETCDGTGSCPVDGFQLSSVECRVSPDVCDPAENCTGVSASCPADSIQADGTVCGDGIACTANDTCGGGVCSGDWSCTSFVDETIAANLPATLDTYFDSSYGLTWADYDNDGHPDLFVSRGSIVYRNMGNGTFTIACGPNCGYGEAFSRTGGWADADNDGDMDFVAKKKLSKVVFYVNDNSGVFANFPNQVVSAGLDIASSPVNKNIGGMPWLDYNNDGWMDLLYTQTEPGYEDNLLMRNNGDLTFTPIPGSATGLDAKVTPNGENAVVGDLNNDGWIDIVFNNDEQNSSAGAIYFNDQDGTFTESSAAAGFVLDYSEYSPPPNGPNRAIALGDYDNDGWLDIFVSHPAGTANRLFRNNQNGTFALTSVLNQDTGSSRGASWGDFDNDGDLDLFVANMTATETGAPNTLYRQESNGGFTDIAPSLDLDGNEPTALAIFADYDNDGDLDLFIDNIVLGAGPDFGNTLLWRNNTNDTKYLKVKVVGRGGSFSSVDGIGTRIELWDAANTTLLAIREVSGGNGYGQQKPQIVHFGLAAAWGGGYGAYTVRAKFLNGDVISQANVVPARSSIVIGTTVLSNTIEIRQ